MALDRNHSEGSLAPKPASAAGAAPQSKITNHKSKIIIVGCGPGSPDFVTPAARHAVAQADVITGAPRLFDLFPECRAQRIPFDAHINRLLDTLAALPQDQRLVILVSGDPAVFSLTQNVLARFGPTRCTILPAVSSVQLAFARLGLSWLDAKILSAHGRTPPFPAAEASTHLAPATKIAILAGTPEAARWSAATAQALSETHVTFLCQNLSLATESIQQLNASDIASLQDPVPLPTSSLALVLIIRRDMLTSHRGSAP